MNSHEGARGSVQGGPTTIILILSSAFAASQAFRTLPSIVLPQLDAEFGIGPAEASQIGMIFHVCFALCQLPFGALLDRYSVRLLLAGALFVAALGAGLSAAASGLTELYVGQVLLGVGCAPTLMAAMVLFARAGDSAVFTKSTGVVMSVGSVGILVTSAPFAWLVSEYSWRASFLVMAAVSLAISGACIFLPRADAPVARAVRSPGAAAVPKAMDRLLIGVLAAALVTYSSVLTMRSLWVVPLAMERHEMSITSAGNVTLAFSIAIALSPLVLGWAASKLQNLELAIVCGGAMIATCLWTLGAAPGWGLAFDLAVLICLGLVSATNMWTYAIARQFSPSGYEGRFLSMVNLATFSGVALAQWLSGSIGRWAMASNTDYLQAICFCLAAFCAVGTLTFALLVRRSAR